MTRIFSRKFGREKHSLQPREISHDFINSLGKSGDAEAPPDIASDQKPRSGAGGGGGGGGGGGITAQVAVAATTDPSGQVCVAGGGGGSTIGGGGGGADLPSLTFAPTNQVRPTTS